MIGAIDPMWHTLPPGTMLLERKLRKDAGTGTE